MDSQTISNLVEEWRSTAREAAQWADQVAELAREMQPHLSSTESAEQLRIAATLAQSASEASGARARKLKQSAVNAAQKSARLAQLVIFDLSKMDNGKMRDQILAWSKTQSLADKLATLPMDTAPSTKKWWEFW